MQIKQPTWRARLLCSAHDARRELLTAPNAPAVRKPRYSLARPNGCGCLSPQDGCWVRGEPQPLSRNRRVCRLALHHSNSQRTDRAQGLQQSSADDRCNAAAALPSVWQRPASAVARSQDETSSVVFSRDGEARSPNFTPTDSIASPEMLSVSAKIEIRVHRCATAMTTHLSA